VHLHGAAGMVLGAPPERLFHAVPLAIARGPAPGLLDQRSGQPSRQGMTGR